MRDGRQRNPMDMDVRHTVHSHLEQNNMCIYIYTPGVIIQLCMRSAISVQQISTPFLVLKLFWNSLHSIIIFGDLQADIFPLQT